MGLLSNGKLGGFLKSKAGIYTIIVTSLVLILIVYSNVNAQYSPPKPPKPPVEVKKITKTELIPFDTIREDDPNLSKGQTQEKQQGQLGEKTVTYTCTYENGKEVSRVRDHETVTKQPVNAIIKVGTYVAPPPPPEKPKSPTFQGYDCTEDCSGHEAGYEWAEDNGITDPADCGGNSDSFIEGCEAYAEEYVEEHEEDYYDDGYYEDDYDW